MNLLEDVEQILLVFRVFSSARPLLNERENWVVAVEPRKLHRLLPL